MPQPYKTKTKLGKRKNLASEKKGKGKLPKKLLPRIPAESKNRSKGE